MAVIGVDAHKRTHTLVVLDEVGRKLGERTVAATSEGHFAAVRWTGQWPARSWPLEDCRHLTRRLERDLLAAGERVVRVPAQLMAAPAAAGGSAASPTRSTPRRWPWRRCGTRTCRPPGWTGRPGRSSCCRITATTW